MWSIVGIIVACAAIVAIEAPYLIRKRMTRELGFFVFLVVVGFTLSSLQALHYPIPNPLNWITTMFKPMSEMTYRLLK